MSNDPLVLFAAFVVAGLAVGRAARLLTHDDWPPAIDLRVWWVNRTGRWGSLFTCPFCLAPYLAAGDLAWALGTGLSTGWFWGAAWWIVNVWAAVSYTASIIVAYDEPPD